MALEKARVAKSLGDINPLEFPLQLASAIAWMVYGEADHLIVVRCAVLYAQDVPPRSLYGC
jgi:hypothetical protein